MMHGAKKSHSSIVPAKPANKAEQSVAESVEGDDGTKRNAELQSTVRTQSREAVSQAQHRIREAVNRNKKEKLTALLHHVSVDVLRWAFFNLKKQAAPGVDGLTWVDYAVDLERNLTDLHARVHSGAYRALPSRSYPRQMVSNDRSASRCGLHNAPHPICVWEGSRMREDVATHSATWATRAIATQHLLAAEQQSALRSGILARPTL